MRLTLILAALLLQDDGSYKLKDGPRKVGTIENLVLRDDARKKDLQLRINYPDGDGPFPVIVFSHGAHGAKKNYQPLTTHLAGHGYVTIQPNHSDSYELGGRPGDADSFTDWENRPKDISFILDSFDAIVEKAPALKGKLDAKRIGVGGHSFGAHTAQLIGGVQTIVRGTATSHRDKRVLAVLLLSPQGRGDLLTDKSWETLAVPALVMSGTKDESARTGKKPEWRREAYDFAPAGDKYLVWVDGLFHNYGGLTGAKARTADSGPDNKDHVDYAKMTAVAFFDAYVKGEKEAKTYLAGDGLTTYSKKGDRGEAEVRPAVPWSPLVSSRRSTPEGAFSPVRREARRRRMRRRTHGESPDVGGMSP